MAEEFILRSVDIDRDAEALAKMWNESDDQWPGSWTRGIPMTAERIRRWYEEEDALDVLVWAKPDGEIVGYCSFQRFVEEEGVGYVAVLNVHPAYQRRSLGRKFLTTYVERSIKLGFRRLDLHTWSGNLKSVPTYKKTGFFWMPDTTVYMLNFIPAILPMPWARPYFDKHDWYTTYVRTLEQHEDDERWRGMKVFTYHWEEGGEGLTVWVDREARALTAVETDKFFAAAIPDSIAPPKGLSVNLHWELRNKSDKPLNVSLVARGSEYLKLDYRDSFVVAPGEVVERVAPVSVEAKMPRVQKRRPAPKMQTLLLMDGELLELGTGLRPEPAVVVETMPKHFVVAPGAKRTIHVQLRNALDIPMQAHLNLVAPEGLTMEQSRCDVQLPAYGQSGLPLTVEAEASGVYPIQALLSFTVNGQQGEAAPQELPVMALYPGEVMAYEDEEGIQVAASDLTYRVHREGGRFEIFRPERDRSLGHLAGEYGPPFEPPEFRFQQAKLSWRRENNSLVVSAEMASQRFPGVTLRRELHFSGGPLVKVVYRTLNQGDKPHELEFLQYFQRRWEEECQVTIPLRSRLLRTPTRDFPRGDQEVPRKSDDYAEKWFAFEMKDATLGFIWNQAFDEVRYEWSFCLRRAKFEAPPHEWAEAFQSWLYVGRGDWRDVQRAYLHLSGRASTSLREPKPMVSLKWDPAVPLTQSSTLAATLQFENARQRMLKGDIHLTPPSGWAVEPSKISFEGVDRSHPLTAKVTLRQEIATPGAYAVAAKLSTPVNDTHYLLPFVRLGDGSEVSVSSGEQDGQPTYTIDNRHTRFVVAPRFSAAVVAWITADGINHLDTKFPVVAAKSWLAPWYGGICPLARTPEDRESVGKLYEEIFATKLVVVRDDRGVTWHGVRLTTELQREAHRGLHLELEYLTTGGSPLLKAVYRLENRGAAVRKLFGAGWMGYWAVDGDFSQHLLRGEDWESKRTDFVNEWVHAGHWGSVTNPATGRTAIVVCPESAVVIVDEGRDATAINVDDEMVVPPFETVERVAYFALAPDFASARAYACLEES